MPSKVSPRNHTTPLAERMRPRTLDEFVGQEHLVREDRLLRQLQREHYLPSLILWGPPGTGKTTLARILARESGAEFVFFSAVLSGVKEIRQIVEQAGRRRAETGGATVLFVDEIHRFNKSQQDAFLPHVESGLLTLIGATTENPSFQVIAPLLSRCRVLVLNPLTREDLRVIVERALADRERGLGSLDLALEPAALEHLLTMADGDGRNALNSLEIAASLAAPGSDGRPAITLATVEEAIQRKSLRYDMGGEEHYNLISALHKSLRDSDPDGALYWLARMLAAGEEPLYLARRLIRFASEDIGNADPQALTVALNARESYHLLGTPEGELALVQATLYLATAPKSNAVYVAFGQVRRDIERTGSLPVPMHIRNAPTRLMKEIGYGRGYRYAHDEEEALVPQEHLPPELQDAAWYHPTNRGYEAVIKDRLTKWREILNRKKSPAGPAGPKGEPPR
ncbi:MAG: replication-associated recombination protein A [Desulfobacteraceae bacterium]|nr:replication-associated recombination protein A [Desulfobacteraceae bacterium]